MKINTKELKEITSKLATVFSADNAANLLNIKSNNDQSALYFNLSSGEFFVSIKLKLESVEEIYAAVETKSFIDIINGVAADEIDLAVEDKILKISANKSKYKLQMFFEGTVPMAVAPITIPTDAPEVDCVISSDILRSIEQVNTTELHRVPAGSIKTEIGKLYYITDSGCLTSANGFGACLNSFVIPQPIDLLVNQSIVKLFKLFTGDINLVYNFCQDGAIPQAIVMLTSDSVRLVAYTTANKSTKAVALKMLYKLREAASNLYQNRLVINTKELAAALNRLSIAAKHMKKATAEDNYLFIEATDNKLILKDKMDNSEELSLDDASETVGTFNIITILDTVKPLVDDCTEPTITLCGNSNGMFIFTYAAVNYFLAPILRDRI